MTKYTIIKLTKTLIVKNFSFFLKRISIQSQKGFQIDARLMDLSANKIIAFKISANYIMSLKHQFENRPQSLSSIINHLESKIMKPFSKKVWPVTYHLTFDHVTLGKLCPKIWKSRGSQTAVALFLVVDVLAGSTQGIGKTPLKLLSKNWKLTRPTNSQKNLKLWKNSTMKDFWCFTGKPFYIVRPESIPGLIRPGHLIVLVRNRSLVRKIYILV